LKPGLPRTFDDGWDKRWVTGAAGDKSLGEWKHTAGEYYGGDEAAAKGIETSDDMRHYFLATKMDEFSNKGSDLVIQYSLKYTKTPECGGSYIKLLGAGADPAAFDNDTPYRCVQPGTPCLHLRGLACAACFASVAPPPAFGPDRSLRFSACLQHHVRPGPVRRHQACPRHHHLQGRERPEDF